VRDVVPGLDVEGVDEVDGGDDDRSV